MTLSATLARLAVLGFCLGAPTTMAAEFRDLGTPTAALPSLDALLGATDPRSAGNTIAAAINLDPGSGLVLKHERALPLNLGRAFRFTQTFAGIPIWNAEVILEQDQAGATIGIDGKAVFGIDASTQLVADPDLSPALALARAKEAHGGELTRLTTAPYENEEASLVYFVTREGALELAYYTTFFTTALNDRGEAQPTRPVYILDADTGFILDFYENIQHDRKGTGPGGNLKTGLYTYGTGLFPMLEVTENGANCDMDGPNVLTENLNHATSGNGAAYRFPCFNNTVKEINGAYSPLNDGHSFGQVAFDMYNEWYGASPLTQKLHMRIHYHNGYENAFWDGRTMTFGDGKDRFYPLDSLDVVNHELSHGFTEQNSGLIYRNQSGGMNEAFSDMAGEAAEFYFVGKSGKPFTRPMPDLETGADIFKAAGSALRYLCDPKKDGRSKDHVRDYYDGLDVHYSSGIYNKAFCLISKSAGWDVRKAFDIFVVANQAYWAPNETFQQGAEGVLKAAQRLNYPEAGVIAAFHEVGIELAPPKIGYLSSTVRVIGTGAERGCGYAAWDCMAALCKADLQNASAWRGWAGCYRDEGVFQCYFECGSVRKFN